MTTLKHINLKALRDLALKDAERWKHHPDGTWKCRACDRDLYLAAEMEPYGLCDACHLILSGSVIGLIDEVERLRDLVNYERAGRIPGCRCHLEQGDSPCPVHPSADDAEEMAK